VAKHGHEVHYDLLTGKLFISGKPSGRLPHEIVKHPTYFSLLDAVGRKLDPPDTFLRPFQTILDVTPADIPGMEFMTKSTVFGHQVMHYPSLSVR
jgi:hypothetical protein